MFSLVIDMPDKMTPQQRHDCMTHIRSKNTKPEILVRHTLWTNGFRYRLHDKRFPGKPDIVLSRYKTVIFINGCFWHGHTGCKDFVIPKTNTAFWIDKITKNKERDEKDINEIRAAGWKVYIIWECELKKATFDSTMKMLLNNLYKK